MVVESARDVERARDADRRRTRRSAPRGRRSGRASTTVLDSVRMRIRARSVHTYVRSVPSPFFSPSVKNSAEAASLALFQARGWSLATYCKHGAFASTPRSRHRGSRRRDARAPRRVAARTRLILGVARRRPSEGFATRRARAPDAAPARRRRASSRVAILRSDVAAAALETSPSRNPRRRARLRRRPAPRRRDPKRGLCSFLSPRFFLPSLTSPLPSSLPRSGARSGHRPAPPPRGSGGAQAQAQAPRAVAELVLHGREVPGASASEADVFFSRARNPKIYRDAARAHPPASDDARADARSPLLSSPPRNYQGCFNITTVFSHSQTVVLCGSCSAVLCQPTGGRARLTEGCSFRRKGD